MRALPLLTVHFPKEISEEYNQPAKELDKAALTALQEHDWTGNIRELRNAVERLIILSDAKIIRADVERYVFMK